MLRFFAILIIAYLIIKLLRGLFQTNVIVKNYHYNSGDNANKKTKNEGDVKISGSDGSTSHKSDDMGEYVDYEEIKD